jgi:uncharacterized integral membrane protein (TIGR00697 family)
MFDLQSMIQAMHLLPAEMMGLFAFTICSVAILLIRKFFNEIGLTLYISIALIAANIQVLKAGEYALFSEPVVLGTVTFASIFLAIDMLNEFYGSNAARRAVYLGFISSILVIALMIPALGVKPLSLGADFEFRFRSNEAHNAMLLLFLPIPSILIASLSAYLISQYVDIWLYQKIRQITSEKKLWLRAFLSNITSSLLDNIVFSILAWKILAINPVSWYTLFWTYIVGTYTIRLLMGVIFIPILYISKLL